jgi:predicted signal transduction protein with EAL and GGDEF domain
MAALSTEPFEVGPPGGLFITTSIGWAAYPFSQPDVAPQPEDVVRLADRALYRAKRAGRNCAVGITPASQEPLEGGMRTGTVELLKDLGISVTFTMVKGQPRAAGQDLTSLRGTGPVRRPV